MKYKTILCAFVGILFSTMSLGQSPLQMAKTMKLMKQFQQQVAEEKLDKAADTVKQLLPLVESMFGKNSPDLIRMEINRGTILRNLGRYDEAISQTEEAMQHAKSRLGGKHGISGVALNARGAIHRLEGEHQKAQNIYQQSIAILERAGSEFDGDRVDAYSNYGDLLNEMGHLTEGRRYTKLALELSGEKFGEVSSRTATLLNNLGMQQRSLGNLPEAEKTMRRTVALYTRLYDEHHQEVASSLQNLALVLAERGKYDEAIEGYGKAISILQKKLGATHPTVLTARANLGQLYTEIGDSKKALPLLMEVLQAQKELLGETHRSTVTTQQNLGVLRIDLAEYEEATKLLESSLATLRETQPGRLGDATILQSFLGLIDAVQGKVADAIKRLDETARTANDAAWRELPALNSNEQGRFMIAKYNPAMFTSLSLGIQFPENKQVIDATAEWSANSKGIAAEALAVARRNKGKPSQESLGWVTLDDLRNEISENGVWIDITRHDFVDFKGKNYKERLQDPKYVAWIVPKKGEVSRIELGNVVEIDALVETLRAAIGSATGESGKLQALGEVDATREVKKVLADVADRVWKPLEARLPEATKAIHLSPDGSLWLLPWNALPVGDEFLVKRFAVTTFVSGRNFVADDGQAPEERSASAVFANPRFDQTVLEKRAAYTAVFRQPPPQPGEAPKVRAFDSGVSRAAPLPGTELEARAILPSMTKWLDGDKPVRYSGTYALESIAKQVVSPKSLVFATHGFFKDDDGKRSFDPLQRCGLLLAGCNVGESVTGNDDGVLTGTEIAELKLEGTELVVLSACETGVGRIENGNGVAGIRRAFHLAGARSVASTLWQVPDFETAKLMGDFFAELANGKSKGEALRQAQIRRIDSREKRNGAAHPFFWAGFSVSGR